MDCRMPALAALVLTLGSGCVTTPMSQSPGGNVELPPGAVVQKAPDGPRRAPMPATVVALGQLKEREADKKAAEPVEQMKLYDEARQCYQEAFKIDPHHRDAIQCLARVYTHMDDYEHALPIYQKALEKTPKDHGLWFDMGMCYSRKKEIALALPCFQKAHNLDPENRQYMKTLGFALARLGQPEQGLVYLTKAMGTAQAHYNLARMLGHMGQRDECRQHLQLALQINPDLADAREMLAAMVSLAAPVAN